MDTTPEKILIPIDMKTVRCNPNAGRTSMLLPGRTISLPDGGFYRPIHRIHSLTPDPQWLYSYETVHITCPACKACFTHHELDEMWGCEHLCPKCLYSIDIEYEQFKPPREDEKL